MTWTWDVTLLASSQNQQIRSMVRDTDTTGQLVQDEEIAFALLMHPTPLNGTLPVPPYLAAAAICDTIAASFAQQVQNSVGPLSESPQQKFVQYNTLAEQYRILYATNGRGIVANSLAGVRPAAPTFGGGGPSYLGTTPYADPEGM